MAFTYSVWMPTARKHELQERAKLHKALAADKSYTPRPYIHAKGRIIASMDSAAHAKLLAAVQERMQPALPAGRCYFDGKDWMTQAEYDHARMIAECAKEEIREAA